MPNLLSKCHTFFSSHLVGTLMVGICSSWIVSLGMHMTEPQPPTIAMVDITGLVNQFVETQVKLHLPDSELKQRVNQFGHQLQTTLTTLAEKQHEVILMQEAVVAGVPDVTPVVKTQLAFYQSNMPHPKV